jgi:uncharacterized protein
MSSTVDRCEFDTVLRTPSEAEVERALAAFASAVRHHYQRRLKGIYLFGSRARGENTPESDADVAVVLADDEWDYWKEKLQLTDLAFDSTHASGIYVQAWPFAESAWNEQNKSSRLTWNARRDSKPIGTAA